MLESFRTIRADTMKKKVKYDSRQWLQGGAGNTAFIQTHFSESRTGGWFDSHVKLSDCSRMVTIHPLDSETDKDKQAYIKKLRVITGEIDKLIKKIEGGM